MSHIKPDPFGECVFNYQDVSNTTLQPGAPFQPWLAGSRMVTNDYKPYITPYIPVPTYNYYSDSLHPYNVTRINQYSPTFDFKDVCNPLIVFEDDRTLIDQPRPSSVLSVASSASSSVSSYSSTADNCRYSNGATYDVNEAVQMADKPETSVQSKTRKRRAERYKRYPKPPYSYCALIITAIENSPRRRLTLAGIHAKLMELFEFFRGSYTGWKDCVRHNLSHNACFYKVPYPLPGEDEVTGRMSGGRHFWKVDLTRAPDNVFRIICKKAAQSGNFRTYIHDELGLPEITIPTEKDVKRERDTSKNTPETQTHRLPVKPDVSDTTEDSSLFMDQTTPRPRYSMRLPHLGGCFNPTESPEQFQRRESTPYESVTPSDVKTEPSSPSAKRRRIDVTIDEKVDEKSTEKSEFDQLLEYVRSLTTGDRASTDAINNLSYLCGTPDKQS